MNAAQLDKGDYPHCGELGAWFCVCLCVHSVVVYSVYVCVCTASPFLHDVHLHYCMSPHDVSICSLFYLWLCAFFPNQVVLQRSEQQR